MNTNEVVAAIRAGSIDDQILAWDAVQAYCDSDGLSGFIGYALDHNVLGFGQTITQRPTDADGKLVDSVYQLENVQSLEREFTQHTGIAMSLSHDNRSRRQAVD